MVLLCIRTDDFALLQSRYLSEDVRRNVLFFQKFSTENNSNFIARSQILVGGEIPIDLAPPFGCFSDSKAHVFKTTNLTLSTRFEEGDRLKFFLWFDFQ